MNLGDVSSFVQLEADEGGILDPNAIIFDRDKFDPKVVYMPAEINFDKLKKVDNTFKFYPDFLNVIDRVCEEINSIFNIMDLDAKLIGLSEDEETKPIFRNS